jgi:hypothetical protein
MRYYAILRQKSLTGCCEADRLSFYYIHITCKCGSIPVGTQECKTIRASMGEGKDSATNSYGNAPPISPGGWYIEERK